MLVLSEWFFLQSYHTCTQGLHPLRDFRNIAFNPRSPDQTCALSASPGSASWGTGHIVWDVDLPTQAEWEGYIGG